MATSTIKQSVSIRLADKNRENIDRFAKLTKRSRSFIINEALDTYLTDRMNYIEDLDAALASIETKPSYNSDLVHAGLRSWGTDDEVNIRSTLTSTHAQKLG